MILASLFFAMHTGERRGEREKQIHGDGYPFGTSNIAG